MFKQTKLSHSRPLLRSLNALNVYQINLYQHLNFMYKFKNKQTPKIFNDIIDTPVHQYPTKFSKPNFSVKRFALRSTKYSRGEEVFWELRRIHPCDAVILMKLSGSSIEIILRHGCSLAGLPRIFQSTCSWEHLWGTASEHVNM